MMTAPAIDSSCLEALDFAPACGVKHPSVPNGCDRTADWLITIHGCAVSAGPRIVPVPACDKHLRELRAEWDVLWKRVQERHAIVACLTCPAEFFAFSEFVTSVVPL